MKPLIQPKTIQREIEHLMGRSVGFAWKESYDLLRDDIVLRFSFECDGRFSDATVGQSTRALSLDEFSRLILAPMVAEMRKHEPQEECPMGCAAGWISEEA